MRRNALARSRLAGSDFLQGRHDVHARGAASPEQVRTATPVRTRQCGGRAQHVPVQVCVQSEVRAAVGQQQRKKPNPPDREQHSQSPAERRQQHALGQQLPDDAKPARAHAQPHRHFAPPRRGARQQQIGDIGARQGQDQSHQRHQHIQRLRVLPAQAIQPARAFFDDQLRKIRALADRWRRCPRPNAETPEPARPAPARGSRRDAIAP